MSSPTPRPSDPIALGLPHREPFIFVDAVVELTPGVRAVGRKVFAADDPVFRGHFPGDPIVPGVLLTEALAQLAGIVVGQPGGAGGMRLAAIKGMKFPGAAKPEEVIELHAAKAGNVGELWQFSVEARVGERLVADGVVILAGAG